MNQKKKTKTNWKKEKKKEWEAPGKDKNQRKISKRAKEINNKKNE